MEKKYKPVPAFNDHPGCKGHGNSMLECTYETQEERDLLSKVLDHYIKGYEKKLAKK